MWTAVLIAVQVPNHSALELGDIAVSAQIGVMSIGLALAVFVASRSRVRAGIGVALALSVPAVRTLVMWALDATAGTLDFYQARAIIITLIVTCITLATAGWVVARRQRRECLWALPLAAVLALVWYLVVDSDSVAISLGWSKFLSSLGWTVFVVPAVVSAWVAVALDHRFGRSTMSSLTGPRTRGPSRGT